MTSAANKLYNQACNYARETALLVSVESLLGWDERCLLPHEGGEYRAEQMTLLSGMVHDRHTNKQFGDWLGELAGTALALDPASDTGATIRQLKRQFDRSVKLPKTLVEELTRTSVRGQQVWQEARAANDFASYRPVLEHMFELKRQQAEALGYEECPYDALLDEYEQGERASNLRKVLAALRSDLVPLVTAICDSGRQPNIAILESHYPLPAQEAFGREVAARLGFDFRRGRLDVTAHPFCSSMGPHDHRITTRYDEKFFSTGLFGILHEAGHGLYEQGLRGEHFGMPLGEAVSLGIHESQSRLWENLVARSRAFWEHFFPAAQRTFFDALRGVSLDDFYFAINDVRPSLIRVEADEATYNLHILIRFELEQALLSGELVVADLPGVWNDEYTKALGITPPNDSDGVLQDIHWSAGLIGYFPTYTLGNLYAAQLFAKADADLGDLASHFARGEFEPLLSWLNDRIHQHGQRQPAAALAQHVTGQPLSHQPLIAHLRSKLGPLYDLS